eukprot:CAMPEP_0184484380 /NCGR_PEP_ID=MMETSP0113_2-20130426/6111_1 /TAXON_ID=91329 /ORGANISM="Norrisiella sphaerica, Strain BC52" /LENGTH=559 /DNA_ID=CAMNT_0026865363 /DNA_START=119 /DNA_END=1794 /DNA_ORIENTATION=+
MSAKKSIESLFVVDAAGNDGLMAQNIPEIMLSFRQLRLQYEKDDAKDEGRRKQLIQFIVSKVLDTKIQSLALRREAGLFLGALMSSAQISDLKAVFAKLKAILSGTKRELENRLCAFECLLRLVVKLRRQFTALFFSQIIQIISKQIRDSNDEIREMAIQVLMHLVDVNGPQDQTNDISKIVSRAASDRGSARVRFCAGVAVSVLVHQLQDIKELNLFTLPCQKALADPNSEVRVCFATALGSLFAVAATTHQQQKGGEALASLDRGLSCLQAFFTKEQAAQSRAMFAHSVAVLLRNTSTLVKQSDVSMITKKVLGFIHLNTKSSFAAIRTDADARQSAECVVYIIWHGLIPLCDERSLEAIGEALTEEIKTQSGILEATSLKKRSKVQEAYNEPLLLASLKMVSLLLLKLGKSGEGVGFLKPLVDSVFFLCSASRHWPSFYAASCLRQVVRVSPCQAGTWVRFLENFLSVSIASLEGNDRLSDTSYCEIHGHLTSLTAVISALPSEPYGIPISLLARVFDAVETLLAKHSLMKYKPGQQPDRKDAALWSRVLERAWEL